MCNIYTIHIITPNMTGLSRSRSNLTHVFFAPTSEVPTLEENLGLLSLRRCQEPPEDRIINGWIFHSNILQPNNPNTSIIPRSLGFEWLKIATAKSKCSWLRIPHLHSLDYPMSLMSEISPVHCSCLLSSIIGLFSAKTWAVPVLFPSIFPFGQRLFRCLAPWQDGHCLPWMELTEAYSIRCGRFSTVFDQNHQKSLGY